MFYRQLSSIVQRFVCTAIVVVVGITTPQAIAADGEWHHYAGDGASTKYNPIDQIDKSNVTQLKEVWRWNARAIHGDIRGAGTFKTTPIVVNGIMYATTSFSHVYALNAATGGAILYVALFPALLGYIFWNRGVKAVGANVASQFQYLMPLWGSLLAVIFLGEDFRLFHLAGIVLIFGGVYLATLRRAERPAPAA